MTARERSKELQQAKSQKVQETVHQVLYCDTDWNEHEIYGQRFRKIIERSLLNDAAIEVSKDVLREYKRRIDRKFNGKESLDKSLVFYQILLKLDSQPMDRVKLLTELETYSEGCISTNLKYLEETDFIVRSSEEYRLTPKTKRMIKTK